MKNNNEYCSPATGSHRACRVNMTVHQFAESLGNAIDAKDPYTCSHSEDVAVLSHKIGMQMGLEADRCDLLHIAGHLHDIGKIGVPDAILQKDGRLTDEEFKVIQRHPQVGADIVSPVTSLTGINIITRSILHHHERFDGKGYPYGLAGEDIPLEARIIAVADTLSAMASNRPYRKALPFTDIVAEINRCSGTQFDPRVVGCFNEICSSVAGYFRCTAENFSTSLRFPSAVCCRNVRVAV
ncbi:HD-GYP domain-containing protein [Maridesulfovibrio sp. FT414]|uniref:HD-GYP domain-containing protein n=1 Tax=Maridesulfovibrio sp. FT414 TaxID=2979469 RepID=UPI003D80648E